MAKFLVPLVMLLSPALAAVPAEGREPVKPVSGNAQAQAWVDLAWAALDQEMWLPNIDEAIASLEKALALDPENPEILVEIADEYYQRGDQMPRASDGDYRARAAWFLKGLAAAEKALALRESAGAHYWAAVNLAASCENRGRFRQAMIFPTLDEHTDWIQEHDRLYKYGAVARFWSRVVTRVPDVVVRMVGEDPNRVQAALDEAVRAEPRFVDNYVYQAEFYEHQGRRQDALAALRRVFAMDPEDFPEERAYNRYAQRKARSCWREWTGQEAPRPGDGGKERAP